jgi:hypothetical protein
MNRTAVDSFGPPMITVLGECSWVPRIPLRFSGG